MYKADDADSLVFTLPTEIVYYMMDYLDNVSRTMILFCNKWCQDIVAGYKANKSAERKHILDAAVAAYARRRTDASIDLFEYLMLDCGYMPSDRLFRNIVNGVSVCELRMRLINFLLKNGHHPTENEMDWIFMYSLRDNNHWCMKYMVEKLHVEVRGIRRPLTFTRDVEVVEYLLLHGWVPCATDTYDAVLGDGAIGLLRLIGRVDDLDERELWRSAATAGSVEMIEYAVRGLGMDIGNAYLSKCRAYNEALFAYEGYTINRENLIWMDRIIAIYPDDVVDHLLQFDIVRRMMNEMDTDVILYACNHERKKWLYDLFWPLKGQDDAIVSGLEYVCYHEVLQNNHELLRHIVDVGGPMNEEAIYRIINENGYTECEEVLRGGH